MVVPIMLVLLLVVFDLGRGFHAYTSVTNGARHAARVAMQEDKTCTKASLATFVQSGSSPYTVTFADPVETDGLCYLTVSYHYTPVLPFVSTAFELPGIGPVGPLWDGNMSVTAVAKVDGKTGDGT
jgi:Flp pilus assembly protein TadG